MNSDRPGSANSAHPRHLSRIRRNRIRRNRIRRNRIRRNRIRRNRIWVIMLVLSAGTLLCAAPAARASATANRPASATSPVTAPAASLTSPAVPVAAPAAAPATTALQQLEWLIGASARPPISTAELDQHLTPQLLAAAGGPAGFNQGLESVGKLSVQQLLLNQPAHVEAITGSANGDAAACPGPRPGSARRSGRPRW
jgi:hypothetical protein